MVGEDAIEIAHQRFVGAWASPVRGCLGGAKGRSHWFVL